MVAADFYPIDYSVMPNAAVITTDRCISFARHYDYAFELLQLRLLLSSYFWVYHCRCPVCFGCDTVLMKNIRHRMAFSLINFAEGYAYLSTLVGRILNDISTLHYIIVADWQTIASDRQFDVLIEIPTVLRDVEIISFNILLIKAIRVSTPTYIIILYRDEDSVKIEYNIVKCNEKIDSNHSYKTL